MLEGFKELLKWGHQPKNAAWTTYLIVLIALVYPLSLEGLILTTAWILGAKYIHRGMTTFYGFAGWVEDSVKYALGWREAPPSLKSALQGERKALPPNSDEDQE